MHIAVDGYIYRRGPGGIARMYTNILPRMCDLDPAINVSLFVTRPYNTTFPDHDRIQHIDLVRRTTRPDRIMRHVSASSDAPDALVESGHERCSPLKMTFWRAGIDKSRAASRAVLLRMREIGEDAQLLTRQSARITGGHGRDAARPFRETNLIGDHHRPAAKQRFGADVAKALEPTRYDDEGSARDRA